jgi:AcrR family transcriptional regulator
VSDGARTSGVETDDGRGTRRVAPRVAPGDGAVDGSRDGRADGSGPSDRHGDAPPAATVAEARIPARRLPAGADRPTPERILDAALASFGSKGFEATSLDQLAVELGVRKQTILYHFPSKSALLDAVIDRSSAELIQVLNVAVMRSGGGFDRVAALVRAVFRMALRRPELLGLLREVSRLGPPAATRLTDNLDPLVQRACSFLEAEMNLGHFRRGDARLLLVSCYSTVVGVATEVEVLRAVGIEPSLRSTAVRRRELLEFLRRALVSPSA